MRLDSTLQFVPLAGLSLVGGAGVSIPSNVIDLLGSGPGTPPANIIGNVSLFGADMGVGGGFGRLLLQVVTGPLAFTTGTAATLNVQFQLAPDTATTYVPGTWQTVQESGIITAAQLLASTVIARMDWPPVFPATLRPRYARLNFSIPSATDFTVGSIGFAGVVPMRDDQANKQAANNFVVA